MKYNMKTLVLTAVLLLVCYTKVDASLTDPRVPPKTGPYLDNWFLRILDGDKHIKLWWNMAIPDGSTKWYYQIGAELILEKGGQPKFTNQIFLPDQANFTVKDGQPVTKDPDFKSPTNCKFEFEDVGYIVVKEDYAFVNVTIEDVDIQIRLGAPVPLDDEYTAKTSEFISNVPLRGQFYIIEGIGPADSYAVYNRSSQELVSGQDGVTYFDRWWGHICNTYIWYVAQADTPEDIFVYVGVWEFADNGKRRMWSGYRNYAKNYPSIQFRDIDSRYEMQWSALTEVAWFSTSVENAKYKMVSNATAPASTFIYISAPGYSANIASNYYDSLTADVDISLYEKDLNGTWIQIDHQVIPNTLLQFGDRFVSEGSHPST